MMFQRTQSRGRLAVAAQDRLLIVGAPVLVSGWLAICIWCVLLLSGLAVPPTPPAGDAAGRHSMAHLHPCT